MNTARLPTYALSLLAATLVSLAGYESYTQQAVIPVPGDVPTKGFGTTRNADGSAVKLGEKTTPTRALADLLRDAGRAEKAVKRCAPVPMYAWEFSAYVSLTYNIGEGAFCRSSIPTKLKTGQYTAACTTILQFDKFRDCTKPKVWNQKAQAWECPLVPLRGLTNRRQDEYNTCMGTNQDTTP
jgi:lysozyme